MNLMMSTSVSVMINAHKCNVDKISCSGFIIAINDYYLVRCDYYSVHCDDECKTINAQTKALLFLFFMICDIEGDVRAQ